MRGCAGSGDEPMVGRSGRRWRKQRWSTRAGVRPPLYGSDEREGGLLLEGVVQAQDPVEAVQGCDARRSPSPSRGPACPGGGAAPPHDARSRRDLGSGRRWPALPVILRQRGSNPPRQPVRAAAACCRGRGAGDAPGGGLRPPEVIGDVPDPLHQRERLLVVLRQPGEDLRIRRRDLGRAVRPQQPHPQCPDDGH